MMYPMRGVMSLILAGAIMTGCGSVGSVKKQEEKVILRAESTAIAIFAESCPLTPIGKSEFLPAVIGGAVLSAFAPAVIEFGYDVAVNALEKRADELTASTSAIALGTLYRDRTVEEAKNNEPILKPNSKCLVLIRGGFPGAAGYKEKPSAKSAWGDANSEKTKLEKVNDALTKAKSSIRLTSAPELYAEFEISYPYKEVREILGKNSRPLTNSKGKMLDSKELKNPLRVPMGIAMRPMKVIYDKSGAKRNPDSTKQLIFQVNLKARMFKEGSAPKESKWEDVTLVEGVFDLGFVTIGEEVPENIVKSKPAVTGTLVHPTKIPVEMIVEEGGKIQIGQGYALDLIDVTGQITLTETQEGGDFERLMVKTARDKKDMILKPLTDAIENLGKKK